MKRALAFFCVLTLLCGCRTDTPQPERLAVSPASLSFDADDPSPLTVEIVCTTDWTVTCDASWCTAGPASGSGDAVVSVSVTQNDGSARSATLSVSAEGCRERTLTVNQAASTRETVTLVQPSPRKWDSVKRGHITYQLLLYSFADSGKDGYGDINGVRKHLDYIDALGAQAIWLSPIHPSPSYHGYDVDDYSAVNSKFGTLQDFKDLVSEAHSKGIKVYLDFVLNHSGVGNAWFKQAISSEDSPYRDYYIFSTDPKADIAAGRIPMIEKGGYDSGQWFDVPGVSGLQYHSHFWTSSFADLNYGAASSCETSPAFKAVCEAADGWIEMGVDGFRLDAVKHIYHDAASDENPTFLRKFYDHCNATFKACGGSGDIYMVGEHLTDASQVAPYYAGLPAMFEFSFWWKLRDAIAAGAGSSFAGAILSLREKYALYRSGAVAATKLTNHDEKRAAAELGKSLEKEKLACAVLMTASGEPYIYQGEELGYWGDQSSGDEYVRTPIKWTREGGAAMSGLSGKVDKQMLSADISVEAQEETEGSLLSFYRAWTQLRNNYPALSDGTMEACSGTDRAVAGWYRTSTDGQRLLVLHNFSGSTVSFDPAGEDLSRAIALNGEASLVTKAGETVLKLGAYSSAIFDVTK